MTPFELKLAHSLDLERQHFANKWLFMWHNITIKGRSVDVDDFRGGRIQIGGVVYEGQVQRIYWDAVARYLSAKVHESFLEWEAICKAYGSARLPSLAATQNQLQSFCGIVIEQAIDTDRRLRGRGYPDSVPVHDATALSKCVSDEIIALTNAHQRVLNEVSSAQAPQPWLVQRIERLEVFTTKYRGTLWAVVSVVGIVIAAWKLVGG